MSIRARVEDAMILYANGRAEGALHSLLTAIAATSRRRRPLGTPSQKRPGESMRDGEAFELFLRDEMERVIGVRLTGAGMWYCQFRGEMHPLEHLLYKWLRCELTHEAALPLDVDFVPDEKPGSRTIKVNPSGLVLTHGWLEGLANAVIYVPENADQFGSPARPPTPIHLPGIEPTIGTQPPEAGNGTPTP